jgi:beta-xylosidase
LSRNVEGPYESLDKPFACPDPAGNGEQVDVIVWSPGAGGAIDPAGFKDTDGSNYVVFKVDGNSLAGGGPCGNDGPDSKPTPIMMVKVAADGFTPLDRPFPILDRAEADGPLIEAPNISRMRDGSYALTFSSNCWNTPKYDVSWAKADRVTGPYIRQPPVMMSGHTGLEAPGGASIAADGKHMVFHANFRGGRALYTAVLGEPDSHVSFR